MSRLVFLAVLVVAVAAADLKCLEVPADNKANKYEGCTSSPSKTCAVDDTTIPSWKDQEPINNVTQFKWKNDGYRDCKSTVHLCKEAPYKAKYEGAQQYCNNNCDDDLSNVCIKFVLDNWSGFCANVAAGDEADGCAKDSKFQKWSYYCDKLEANVKNGGKTCTEDAECNLLPCYEEFCYDWCHTAKVCWDVVEAKEIAAKDNKDCKKAYAAPWNAASTVVPSLLALVAVLLAL